VGPIRSSGSRMRLVRDEPALRMKKFTRRRVVAQTLASLRRLLVLGTLCSVLRYFVSHGRRLDIEFEVLAVAGPAVLRELERRLICGSDSLRMRLPTAARRSSKR
jgi:hypothetical protein